jgi:hypothetical protein
MSSQQEEVASLPGSAGRLSHEPLHQSQPTVKSPQRYVPCWLFLITITTLICVALALGLGLGLGLGPPRHRDTAIAPFDYSSYYGIPYVLPVVDSTSLVNQEEMSLNTGFVVSRTPKTREFTFNITQALSAPDGILQGSREKRG